MICKEGSIDVISIGGGAGGVTTASSSNNSANSQQQLNGVLGEGRGSIATITNGGHNTLQHRRKSQLITFSSSSCDIKNSLSHEYIMVTSNNNNNTSSSAAASNSNSCSSNTNNARGSIGSGGSQMTNGDGGGSGGRHTTRLSFAEEDIMIIPHQQSSSQQQQQHQQVAHQNGSLSGSGSGSNASACGSVGHGNDLDDDEVFRRHSLEVDEEAQDALFNEEYGTHIDAKSSNANNDDSGGGSYEDSHALHSSLGGSNRNSLEKDDDEIEVDVISTDASCYDQLLGSSCNTRNDDDEIATLVGDSDNYTKLSKHAMKTSLNGGLVMGGSYAGVVNGSTGVGGGLGETGGGIIYANPFMDDEGIAESGM
uniref:Uncharacterized protein n=1 Tax=Stomoxys calcitrans TaxID=35570 RepID=A0A1I8P4X2_STOCA